MIKPPSDDPHEIRKWADWILSQSTDECWLDASWAKNILYKIADEICVICRSTGKLWDRHKMEYVTCDTCKGKND